MFQRLPFYLVLSLLFTGCSSFEPPQILSQSEYINDQPEVVTAIPAADERYDAELQALFEQPYIDPLTDYLATHSEDENRAEPLRKISAERHIRCQKVANIYAERALTQENLQRYQAAYNYSCPKEVAAFAERLANLPPETSTVISSEEEKAPTEEPAPPIEEVLIYEEVVSKVNKAQLNDCYLLTTISNFREARQVCLSPANEGDVRSQLNMALIHNALGEYPQAVQWARKVEQDAPRAQLLLGELYAAGNGVRQNDETAFEWFKKAAEANNADGQYMTASSYEQGKGVSQNIQQALIWYERAAKIKHLPAKHALGALLVKQSATPSTNKTGQNWLIQAASEGNAASSSLLGELMAQLPKSADKARAVVWFELAAQQGDEAATQRANVLRQQVSQAAINKARLEIQQLLDQQI